jgi:ComF family protein
VPETRPGTVMLLPFSDARVRSAIHEAKYRGSERAFRLLGSTLAEYLRDFDDENYGFTRTRSDLEDSDVRSDLVLVPVPLGKKRRKERGFNQVEEIARRALRSLDNHFILNSNMLERIKETESQVSLERRRREENMHHAFKTTRPADPAHTYIVVDDVLTTGATLQAAIDALKEAGATHIIPLALAH